MELADVILWSFDFENHHARAFFMDNLFWSHADSFLADEKGSEHTEAELIDNLKEVLAKLKANA
ncbi:hypothetical protein [Streptococcus sp. Marseille-Q5986]|uniref:hypothetical protein n=1 Tax=Streptococcus sp. Marseille-Q5986 TaxID=2972782 RepID=UPI0022651B16|nr:hypothetical protein [Streptococcus sp. Marseille-Q5986]